MVRLGILPLAKRTACAAIVLNEDVVIAEWLPAAVGGGVCAEVAVSVWAGGGENRTWKEVGSDFHSPFW